MVKLKSTSASEFDLIPEGEIVQALVDKIEPDSYIWEQKTIDKLKWTFSVTEPGQWEDQKVRGETSTSFTAHPNCRAYNWVAAITGKKYADGEGLDTDDILGMPCRIVIMYQDDKRDPEKKWMRVRDVFPASAAAAAKAAVPEEAPF